MGVLTESIKSNSGVSSKRIIILFFSAILTFMVIITGVVNILNVIHTNNDLINVIVFPEYVWTTIGGIIVLIAGVNGTQSIFFYKNNPKKED